jgi:hypothetical protein
MSNSVFRDGKVFTDSDEVRSEFEFADNGSLRGFKVYGRAKDFRRSQSFPRTNVKKGKEDVSVRELEKHEVVYNVAESPNGKTGRDEKCRGRSSSSSFFDELGIRRID